MRQKQVCLCVILFSLTIIQSEIVPAERINRDLFQNKLQPACQGSLQEGDKGHFGALQLKNRDITEKAMIVMFNIINGTKMVS